MQTGQARSSRSSHVASSPTLRRSLGSHSPRPLHHRIGGGCASPGAHLVPVQSCVLRSREWVQAWQGDEESAVLEPRDKQPRPSASWGQLLQAGAVQPLTVKQRVGGAPPPGQSSTPKDQQFFQTNPLLCDSDMETERRFRKDSEGGDDPQDLSDLVPDFLKPESARDGSSPSPALERSTSHTFENTAPLPSRKFQAAIHRPTGGGGRIEHMVHKIASQRLVSRDKERMEYKLRKRSMNWSQSEHSLEQRPSFQKFVRTSSKPPPPENTSHSHVHANPNNVSIKLDLSDFETPTPPQLCQTAPHSACSEFKFMPYVARLTPEPDTPIQATRRPRTSTISQEKAHKCQEVKDLVRTSVESVTRMLENRSNSLTPSQRHNPHHHERRASNTGVVGGGGVHRRPQSAFDVTKLRVPRVQEALPFTHTIEEVRSRCSSSNSSTDLERGGSPPLLRAELKRGVSKKAANFCLSPIVPTKKTQPRSSEQKYALRDRLDRRSSRVTIDDRKRGGGGGGGVGEMKPKHAFQGHGQGQGLGGTKETSPFKKNPFRSVTPSDKRPGLKPAPKKQERVVVAQRAGVEAHQRRQEEAKAAIKRKPAVRTPALRKSVTTVTPKPQFQPKLRKQEPPPPPTRKPTTTISRNKSVAVSKKTSSHHHSRGLALRGYFQQTLKIPFRKFIRRYQNYGHILRFCYKRAIPIIQKAYIKYRARRRIKAALRKWIAKRRKPFKRWKRACSALLAGWRLRRALKSHDVQELVQRIREVERGLQFERSAVETDLLRKERRALGYRLLERLHETVEYGLWISKPQEVSFEGGQCWKNVEQEKEEEKVEEQGRWEQQQKQQQAAVGPRLLLSPEVFAVDSPASPCDSKAGEMPLVREIVTTTTRSTPKPKGSGVRMNSSLLEPTTSSLGKMRGVVPRRKTEVRRGQWQQQQQQGVGGGAKEDVKEAQLLSRLSELFEVVKSKEKNKVQAQQDLQALMAEVQSHLEKHCE